MKAEEVLSQVEKLPPAPAVLPNLLNLLRDTNSDPHEIIALIRLDPSLTAQVLKLSNIGSNLGLGPVVFRFDPNLMGFFERYGEP